MGPDEDPAADGQAPEQGGKVLDLAAIPDDDVRVDVGILAQDAIAADPRPFTNLDPMPNARPVPDDGLGRHVRGRVNARNHSSPDGQGGFKYVCEQIEAD